MTAGITRVQGKVLRFISGHIQEHGYSPTYQEIAAGLGMKSKTNIQRLVKGLADRGAITFLPGRARSILPVSPVGAQNVNHETSPTEKPKPESHDCKDANKDEVPAADAFKVHG